MDIFGLYTEVLIRWMERIESGTPPLILGDGLQTMDFVHVADIARANILAAQADVTDDVFNIASGTETSLKELAQALSDGHEVRPRPGARPGPRGQRRHPRAGRHRAAAEQARLPRRDRPARGPAGPGGVVAVVPMIPGHDPHAG
jgi:UDP-glucose 4-epimerase